MPSLLLFLSLFILFVVFRFAPVYLPSIHLSPFLLVSLAGALIANRLFFIVAGWSIYRPKSTHPLNQLSF